MKFLSIRHVARDKFPQGAHRLGGAALTPLTEWVAAVVDLRHIDEHTRSIRATLARL